MTWKHEPTAEFALCIHVCELEGTREIETSGTIKRSAYTTPREAAGMAVDSALKETQAPLGCWVSVRQFVLDGEVHTFGGDDMGPLARAKRGARVYV
ncbi:hypothetical protein AN221_23900 [Streptomyces nanshensis]|uniref:Uncharacterized protein n=1 Tax=Streptomyces nanshensis TaxID=518642 RepID=A0A1E7LPR0_9ACTN|nr:hypothetical protein AN221_23900 [Streptomyces nanshensis]